MQQTLNRFDYIKNNIQKVRERIAAAARGCGRDPATVRLLAVSKTFPADDVRWARLAGQDCFGESYLSEALNKMGALADPNLEWHFIGPLQSNKTRRIAESFAWVHGVAELRHAKRLNDQRPDGMPPLNVCLQVNISGEMSKSGALPDALLPLACAVAALPRLRLRGLMAIPAPGRNAPAQHVPFRGLRSAFDALNATGLDLDTLSIGMSEDLEAAVEEGSTIVRIGSAIFGHRDRG